MAELIQHDRLVRIKIVYYGPALSGKTTNLQVLHKLAVPSRRGQLLSLNSQQERTILFDMLPLRAVGPRGYEVALQIVAVPGQSFYISTRRVTLRGADGIVFVANSATDRLNENLLSFRELGRLLTDYGTDAAHVPMVMQYNKRDLPKTLSIDELERALKSGRPGFPAIAYRSEGVVASFQGVLAATMAQLVRRFRVLELPGDQTAEQWARQACTSLFGQDATGIADSSRRPPRPLPAEFGIPSEFASAVTMH